MSANISEQRQAGRKHRHARIRKRVVGLPERPRLCVFRSHKHLYAQLIDDVAGKTILGWSTHDKRLKSLKARGNQEAAKALGTLIAKDAADQKIGKVVFDRGGYLFHGRVKALAEAIREGGIQV
ncbi:MAG: 50S ribosomal protein L18 [Candidatus Omnitrophica bacterium]|nr:50S ribosomal protein L18 [Candidatus Omnitrophota bacterium]MBI2174693.1 50S ribosomal protein L18 [Candidatus Omnitrophota bacterium]MBI3010693.1 50S ribosomal protein L18 [Candidatus Omnitrophota bacterium]